MRLKNMLAACPFLITLIFIGLSGCEKREGYLYFKVGDELFRVNKDSPLIIGGVTVEIDDHGRAVPDF